jgi:hypothetical protein
VNALKETIGLIEANGSKELKAKLKELKVLERTLRRSLMREEAPEK